MTETLQDTETFPILKDLVFVGSSKKDLRALPEEPRRDIGYALDQIQRGFTPATVSSLGSLGKGISGVKEIRVDHDGNTYRSVYVAKLGDEIYVLHVFNKKSTKGIATPKADLDLIRDRYRVLVKHLNELGFQ